MKNPKSTTPEAQAGTSKEADSKPYDPEAWRDEAELCELRIEARKNLPPVSEIAKLAALLSPGHPLGLQTWEIYAQHAINLWSVCYQQRQDWIEKQAQMELRRRKAEIAEAEANFPKPKKFPVSLDEFLKLALPDKRTEDRLKLWRDLLRENIRSNKQYPGTGSAIPLERIPLTTDAEVADCIARQRKRGFDEFQYPSGLTYLRNYAAAIEREKLKIRGQTAGKASAAKRKARPPVEKLKAALLT
jgi:hypothetical protein